MSLSKVFSLSSFNRFMLIPLMVISLMMPACMPTPSIMKMKPEYYPQCYQPFEDLEQAKRDLISRTLIGAGLGAVSGAVAGGIATGDVKGAAIGAGIGAVGGALIGYVHAKRSQYRNDKERMRSYQADINADMRNASRVEQYAMASLQCYTREFNTLLKKYKKGELSKEEVQARYKEIREGMSYIAEILKDSKDKLVQRDEEYREAFAFEARTKNRPAPEVASLEKKREAAAKRRPSANVKGDGSRELRKVSAEANTRKVQAERNAQKVEKQEAAMVAAAEKKKGTSSIKTVSKYYEKQYLNSVVSLEEAENVNDRTLAAMSVAAKHAGIDMV